MTNQFYGSSLFQARKTEHAHRHAQLHDRKINRHLRSHAEFHRRHEDSEPAVLNPRDSTITEVVQTISVVQVIDGSGATVEVQTVSATPQTNLIDGDTGSTIDTNYKAMSLTSSGAEASTTASSATETTTSSVDPYRDYRHVGSKRHIIPVIVIIRQRIVKSILKLHVQLHVQLQHFNFHGCVIECMVVIILRIRVGYCVRHSYFIVRIDNFRSLFRILERTVVGGVVGGVAGLALLVAFAFMLLRLKKKGWGHMRPGNGNVGSAPEARAVGPPPGPSSGGDGGGNGAYGTMERAAPYSVASSLAALAGKRASRSRASSGPEMAERGFVRVSGKKLPPVLQFGGDGYTDPRDRDSVTSDVTVYRDSMAVFNPGQQRLALGSPMRPESGVLVYNPGPAKTPVTSLVPNPLESPTLPRSSTFPPTDAMGTTLAEGGYLNEASSSRDAVGRTLAAQDYSRDGAASRTSRQSRQSGKFTEHVH
ncbi:hypothetical protein VMCG_02941 [Cytospora schulzeri]|uniref:Uncharacterized protein n=1 Tax=Cytospora schulzeri TaxID=448051 RepID=A0A423WZF7_9PEZI|nr:hypothetical protein VMCG_02941 [Valsa malicola]